MFEATVNLFVYSLITYAVAGLAFAPAFVSWGVQRLDTEAQGSGIGFRVLIVLGVMAFWPLFLTRMAARTVRASS
jgi:hypothetical protein